MKKTYSAPCTVREFVMHDTRLLKSGSIQNATGDIQHGIEEDNSKDFEAGAKGGLWGNGTPGSSPWDD